MSTLYNVLQHLYCHNSLNRRALTINSARQGIALTNYCTELNNLSNKVLVVEINCAAAW